MNEFKKPDLSELIEITLPERDNFLKVRETLTRIGIASATKKELYQSVHILHKQGRYYLVHFKELFMLDGKAADFQEEDKARRNFIANLLEQWKLVKIVNPEIVKSPMATSNKVKIIEYKDKANWTCIPKYTVGKKKTVKTELEAV